MIGPYPVDVGDILHDLGATIVVTDDVAVEPVAVGGAEFRPAGPAAVHVTLSNTGAGVVASGSIDVDLDTECSRCLAEFTLHVTGEIEGFYTTPEKAEEISDDQEWEPLGDGIIDLSHALEAAVRIELPLAPLHDEECAGICPVCGVDRNLAACECEDSASAPGPFDALKGLFGEESE